LIDLNLHIQNAHLKKNIMFPFIVFFSAPPCSDFERADFLFLAAAYKFIRSGLFPTNVPGIAK